MSSEISCHITSINALFHSAGQIIVPPYQRNFSWTEEQFGSFWTDLTDCFFGDVREYFLGTVVIDNSSAPDLILIDGQQRLTSSTILIAALRAYLLEQNHDELVAELDRDFQLTANSQSSAPSPNLVLNLIDRVFFEQTIFGALSAKDIIEAASAEKLNSSNRLLAECFAFMYRQIGNSVKEGISTETLAKQIIRALKERVFFIRIDVANRLRAFTVFEALNNRGLELSEADLLKNHIFSKAEENINEVQDHWETMIDNLNHVSVLDSIRRHWNSHFGPVPKQGLYTVLYNHTRTADQALTLTQDLRRSSIYYGALSDRSHELWLEFKPDQLALIEKGLDTLEIFRTDLNFILLMAVLEHCPEELPRLIEMIINLTFRYTTICGNDGSKLGRSYMTAAHYVRTNKKVTSHEIYDQFLKPFYPDDREFQSAFAKKKVSKTALARYILTAIDQALKVGENPGDLTYDKTVDLEHILPKNFKPYWRDDRKQFPGGAKEFINRLGNLTLISRELNRQMGNGDFDSKKEIYAKDCFEITRRVLDEQEWSGDAINRRQNWLASEAKKIWCSPLAS